jgi:predicted flavoprotein YhiN
VQLKTDTVYTKTLKGIRVNDGILTACTDKNNDKISVQGDIIFTDYGISGDAVFRISAFIADALLTDSVQLSIDFLPDFEETAIYQALLSKKKVFPHNLRHLFARTYYNMEKDISKLADILGHSNVNTTRIYIMSSGIEHRNQMQNMRLLA